MDVLDWERYKYRDGCDDRKCGRNERWSGWSECVDEFQWWSRWDVEQACRKADVELEVKSQVKSNALKMAEKISLVGQRRIKWTRTQAQVGEWDSKRDADWQEGARWPPYRVAPLHLVGRSRWTGGGAT